MNCFKNNNEASDEKIDEILNTARIEMLRDKPNMPTVALERFFKELNAAPDMRSQIDEDLTISRAKPKSVKIGVEVDFIDEPTGDGGMREDSITRLKNDEFDMLVIGGGATGLGCALDAARRGHKVAVVDRGDWAEGTSSKSSNMHHGGVRYLQAFVRDPEGAEEQLRVVRNGLAEQQYLYHSAPYLVHPVPIMVPCYSEREKDEYGLLLKKYDELGADDPYPDSYWCSQSEALFRFPQLNAENLLGSWVYYDAEQDDARMALLIALSAQEAGACTVNYIEVKSLEKDSSGKIIGANCEDADSTDDASFLIRAKVVINATGPFSDAIRTMDEKEATAIIKPAAGTHIILPAHFSPVGTGLAILETTDGRAMFYLPWQGRTLIGTTDNLVEVEKWPTAPEEDISFILSEVNRFLSQDVSPAHEKDVLAAWVGIRPLAIGTQSVTGTAQTEATDEDAPTDDGATQKVSREHLVLTSDSGLITITGGKWTSYRHMAEDTIDTAESHGQLTPLPKPTATLVSLVGCDTPANTEAPKISNANAAPFHQNMISLLENYHVDRPTAEKLSESYGSRAFEVCELAKFDKSLRKKISSQHPWIMAQVVYACRHEQARTVADILSRRTRLCQVDVLAAHNATPNLVRLMGEELGWNLERRRAEVVRTRTFLDSCGLKMRLKYTKQSRAQMRMSLAKWHFGGV